MVNLDNQPAYVSNPSKSERYMADVWKSSVRREAREFDTKFNVEDVAGFSDEARELWLAYFTSYVAAKKIPSSGESDAVLDAGSKIPVFGAIARLARSSVNGQRIAWIELHQEVQQKAVEYQKQLEVMTAESAMDIVSRDFDEEMKKRRTTAEEFIKGMKDSGGWSKLYEAVAEVMGSPRSIELSANLASTIYENGRNENSETLKERMKSALKRFAPVMPEGESDADNDDKH